MQDYKFILKDFEDLKKINKYLMTHAERDYSEKGKIKYSLYDNCSINILLKDSKDEPIEGNYPLTIKASENRLEEILKMTNKQGINLEVQE